MSTIHTPTGTLPVSEVFGPVWQGEGPATGRRCSFLRLGGCNLTCEWCDTPYTWDRTRFDLEAENLPRSVEQLAHEVRNHHTDLLILSGGEPLMHQRREELRRLLCDHTLLGDSHAVHVETNGTIPPAGWLEQRVELFTVSPKLAHGGDPAEKRLKPSTLEAFAELARNDRAVWKIVVRDQQDVDEAVHLLDQYNVPARARWAMPEGTTAHDLLDRARGLEHAVTTAGLNLTLRLHTLLYGTERGR